MTKIAVVENNSKIAKIIDTQHMGMSAAISLISAALGSIPEEKQ